MRTDYRSQELVSNQNDLLLDETKSLRRALKAVVAKYTSGGAHLTRQDLEAADGLKLTSDSDGKVTVLATA